MDKNNKKKDFNLYKDSYAGLKQAITFEKGKGDARVYVRKSKSKTK